MSTEEENTVEWETVPDLQAQLDEARREVDQFRTLSQLERADSVNLKRRMEDEKIELQKRANQNLFIRLLPVIDDFERSIQHIPAEDALNPWIAGMELVYRNLKGVMEVFGVTQIEALNKTFDPLEHESVFYEESEDNEDGKVMSIVREGYKLHGWVLRPAQVTVSKRKEQESSHEETSDSTEKEIK